MDKLNPAVENKILQRIFILSLVVAWIFDLLFWKKIPGISFFIFVVICLLGGVISTWWARSRPALTSLLIGFLALLFAAMAFIRQEPFTGFLNVCLALGSMALLAMTWLGGRWYLYSLSDYVVQPLILAGLTLSRPFQFLVSPQLNTGTMPVPGQESSMENIKPSESKSPEPIETPKQEAKNSLPKPRATTVIKSSLLGIILALPVLLVLGALLAAADPVFSRNINQLLELLNLENLQEFIFRLGYILIIAYLLSGVYLYALLSSQKERLIGLEKPWLPPFLGWLEAAIVLFSVDLLFAFFVGIQFRYFFGGQANINVEGFTYAEYARRGFGELVAVALISLLLFLSLSMITQRAEQKSRKLFSGLGIALVGLVAIILVSAFQRLLLYEAAYGFSRIRLYTHVFMICLGLLLVATMILELIGHMRTFALAALICSFGFGLSLNLINVDGLITRQNVQRTLQGHELDTNYLVTLSDDAVPDLFNEFHSTGLPAALHDQLGSVLSCRAYGSSQQSENLSWLSYRWPRANARRLYQLYQTQLSQYPVSEKDAGWFVTVDGREQPCYVPVGVRTE